MECRTRGREEGWVRGDRTASAWVDGLPIMDGGVPRNYAVPDAGACREDGGDGGGDGDDEVGADASWERVYRGRAPECVVASLSSGKGPVSLLRSSTFLLEGFETP